MDGKGGTARCRLVALDMDGTALTRDKRLLPETLAAVEAAEAAGITVVLATGRTASELSPYRALTERISCGVLESGGLLYDFRREAVLWRTDFSPRHREAMLLASLREDIMPLVMAGGEAYVQRGSLEGLERYRVEYYRALFEISCRQVPDIREKIGDPTFQMEKVNFYHTDRDARERTRARLAETGLTLADSEITSLELSPPGVSKGAGLSRLLAMLGVPMEAAAAVGDADNDVSMLRAVGIPVAMGNANGAARAAAEVYTADCDHDGAGLALRAAAEGRLERGLRLG